MAPEGRAPALTFKSSIMDPISISNVPISELDLERCRSGCLNQSWYFINLYFDLSWETKTKKWINFIHIIYRHVGSKNVQSRASTSSSRLWILNRSYRKGHRVELKSWMASLINVNTCYVNLYIVEFMQLYISYRLCIKKITSTSSFIYLYLQEKLSFINIVLNTSNKHVWVLYKISSKCGLYNVCTHSKLAL